MQKLIDGLLIDHDVELPNLECDGFTRVAHYVLHQNGINHRCYHGSCAVGEKIIPTHFWIVAGKYTIDYRLRAALQLEERVRAQLSRVQPAIIGLADVPHGVFEAKLFPHVKYEGREIVMNVPAVLFEILTEGKRTA